jgi:O-antigen/teichoic acid export membrane protein
LKEVESNILKSDQTSYRQIMKTTTIFGGVQVFQILITIIRSKFVAILLGPVGMGIAGLLSSTTGFIAALTNFGLSTSAVKDVAEAHSTGDHDKLRTIITVFRRAVWFTGLLGAVVVLVLAPWLSEITFGNRDYTYAFLLISISLLIDQISTGQSVQLRGMRQIKYLAKAGLIGSVLGLFTTVPLYYFLGTDGIVPGIIVTSLSSLVLSWYFDRKVPVQSIEVSLSQTISEARGMMHLGFMISLSGMITMGASYLVRIYISNTGGLDQVGLYNAGFAIVNNYVGLVFAAMSTDYLPRLSAVAKDNDQSKTIINHQAEIALLILAPIILAFLIFINWVVILLYSSKFIPVNDMILYAALGMFFRAASWSIAFIFLAKGASKLYFWNELITNVYLLGLNLLGYKYFGLTGLGISFLIAYVLYLTQVYIIAYYKYQFSFSKEFYRIFIPQLLLAVSCLVVVKSMASPYSYLIGSIFIAVSGWMAYRGLDKRLEIKALWARFKS